VHIDEHAEERTPMGWLHRLLSGESDSESASVQATPNPAHLVPPVLPDLGRHDPAADHKRGFASKTCPSCEAPVKELSRTTQSCEACGKAIVVMSGEDGQWHLLREADAKAFEERQEQIRIESYKRDEEALLEAGFLAGDYHADVDGESAYQDVLERMAGGRSRTGVMKEVIALLSREPDHPHDKDAIRVDVDSETVGYLEKVNAREIQPLMQRLERSGRPAWVRAWIVGGWEGDKGSHNYRVRIDGLPKVR
jgi:hypothetical protein